MSQTTIANPIDVNEAARRLGVSSRRILFMIDRKQIVAKKFSFVWMVDAESLKTDAIRNRRPGNPHHAAKARRANGKAKR